ncbi:MAG: SDR family oxidoreductase [bacterium]|nr:SDR family oxidoreductase [bacterium]
MTKKTVLITGAAGGIGRAVVKRFALDKNFKEIVLIDHPNKSEDLKQLYSTMTNVFTGYRFDLADLNLCQNMQQLTITFNKIDVLVNVAGIAPANMTPLIKTDLKVARKIMDVNYWGTLNLCKALLPLMQANGYGRIVNVASISAFMADHGNMIYSASKAAVVQLTRALAKEAPFNKNGPPHDITVNAVAPGVIDTDMAKQLKEPMVDGFKKATPFGRLGRPEEIAEVIYWLATKAPQFLTGEIIRVDGGFLA